MTVRTYPPGTTLELFDGDYDSFRVNERDYGSSEVNEIKNVAMEKLKDVDRPPRIRRGGIRICRRRN